MGNITDKLSYLNDTKKAIKNAIISRGISVDDTNTFRDYASKITEIGETIKETRFNVNLDAFLPTVDENGETSSRDEYKEERYDIILSGVKRVNTKAFYSAFRDRPIKRIIADDVEYVGYEGFTYACMWTSATASTPSIHVEFNKIEEVSGSSAFKSFFGSRPNASAVFPKLKKISGYRAFQEFQTASNTPIYPDVLFPSLEEVTGKLALDHLMGYSHPKGLAFSKLKKINGPAMSENYQAVFYSDYGDYYFPSAVEFTGRLWYITSYLGNIHFAIKNREAIEACDNYADKWGYPNATIHFDLVTNIIVNDITYYRKYTIGDYTSWENENGDIVYTAYNIEPSVDSVVYSDEKLTTEFGTVSAIE